MEVARCMKAALTKDGESVHATNWTSAIGDTGSDEGATAVEFNTDGTEDVVTNNVISGDVDGVHGTAGVGLVVTVGLRPK